MASWASVGHGLRRRSGAPSNHFESTGHEMSERTHPTSEEALEAASAAGSARVPAGLLGPADAPLIGTLVPRKNVQAADPTAGGKANRVNIERLGATYRVNANIGVSLDPAAGKTMASARIVTSVQGRATPNFEAGLEASSL